MTANIDMTYDYSNNGNAQCDEEKGTHKLAETDTDRNEISKTSIDVPDIEEHNLTFWGIVAIQAAYSTAGGVISMPKIFGTLGYVAGLLTYFITAFVCDVVLASKGRCKHFNDVGYELAGNRK